MAGIKSIDKLREKIRLDVNNPWSDLKGDLLSLCDKVEREIAERYMELPTDADGVPIHVGDLLQLGDTRSEVMAFEYRPHGKLPWSWLTKDGEWYSTAFTQHVKPRTLEVVLEDMLIEKDETDLCSMGLISKYADEIRELLGVGE